MTAGLNSWHEKDFMLKPVFFFLFFKPNIFSQNFSLLSAFSKVCRILLE